MPVASRILFILCHLVPPLYCVMGYGAYGYFLVSGLLTPIVLIALSERADRRLLPLWMLVSGTIGLVNSFFFASFYLQGEGFNARFFYHLDAATVRVAFSQYTLSSVLFLAYVVACTVLPLHFAGRRTLRVGLVPVAALALLSVLTYAPAWSALAHTRSVFGDEDGWTYLVQPAVRDAIVPRPLPSRPRNLILIYAEGLETTYFDERVFGDIVPALRRLRSEALDFPSIHQVRGTGWTIAGIVASQCAVPLLLRNYDGGGGNTALGAIENPLPGYNCLGDILSAYGYRTVFMGGAANEFSGKGNFLRAHGFDEVLGREELMPRVADSHYRHSWGLYDDSLLQLAETKLDELEAADEPFLLTLLTLDMHHPYGHPSRSCRPLGDNHNPILEAVYCTDQLLGGFVERLRQRESHDETLIVVMSDHLALRNTAWDQLRSRSGHRRLLFFVFGPGIDPGVVEGRGTHFDVAPTILDLLGIDEFSRLNLGWSLLDHDEGLWFGTDEEQRFKALDTDYLGFSLRLEGPVEFSSSGPTIRIGDQRFVCNFRGLDLRDQVFAMLFDAEGDFQGFCSTWILEEFLKVSGSNLAVAISGNDEFNQHFSAGVGKDSWVYYIGYPEGAGGRSGRLTGRLRLAGDEVQQVLVDHGRRAVDAEMPQEPVQALRIAHAGGGIDRRAFTNSSEALLLNLDLGFEFFEFDFVWTSDDRLVTLHDWKGNAKTTFGFEVEQIPDLQQFKQWVRDHSKYENLTLEELAKLMREHPQIVLVTDVKTRNVEALEIIARTMDDFERRVIPQIYKPEEYEPVRAMGYQRIIWTLYRFGGDDREVLDLLPDMELFAVTMPTPRADRGLGLEIGKLGLPTYTHTINAKETFAKYHDQLGIDEIYTDFLAPEIGPSKQASPTSR